MKKFLIFFSCCFFCLSLFCQEKGERHFTFPVKPGEQEWMQMTSPISRIMSIQIPENIIGEIPTNELLKLCLDYPYIIDIVIADNYQKGIDILFAEFNGFRELLNREDIVTVLKKEFETFPQKIKTIKKDSDIEKGYFSFQSFVLELLIAQDVVLSLMDEDQKRSICTILCRNDELKKTEPKVFGEINEVSSSLVLAKIALRNLSPQICKEQLDELNRFVEAPIHLNSSISEFLTKLKSKNAE